MYVRPIIEDYHTLTVTIIRGHLYIQGIKLGIGYSLADLPAYMSVAKVTHLCTYKRGFLDRISDTSGFAVYVKFKVGNYRLPSTQKGSGMDTALLRNNI